MVHKIIPNGPKNCQDCYPVLLACYPISYFGATLPHFFQKMQFRVGHPTKNRSDRSAPARGPQKKTFTSKMSPRWLQNCPRQPKNVPKMMPKWIKIVSNCWRQPQKWPKIFPCGSTKGPKMTPKWFKIALNCPRYNIYIYIYTLIAQDIITSIQEPTTNFSKKPYLN